MALTESAIGNSGKVARQYAPYVQADWGFANHWYPACFSDEVAVRGVVGVTIGGHDIAITREDDGTVRAISDRCLHRGVKLSAKPMCFANKTVTCWYHGYTYNAESGNLDTIVGSPDDKLINTVSVRTYPAEEVAGLIFVFVGDDDYGTPPPLDTDLPVKVTDNDDTPHFRDAKIVTRGLRRKLYGNWRLAAENGLDPSHLLVHWDNQIVVALDRAMPLGMKAMKDDATELLDVENGPKGVMNRYDLPENYQPVFENPIVDIKARGTTMFKPFRVSLWLPGILMVEDWPIPGVTQYEFYVPIDDHHHMYFEVIADHASTEDEKKEFEFKYKNFYEPLGLLNFNNNDVFAREATEEHYERFDGWNNEVLADADFSVVAWRKQAAKHGRGFFQSPYFDED
ncbi:Rieske 2Fe-2S domain-containing protein [Raineyella sp. W15-4]|uniref:Rieske 2Fe-2S domain-containing protein n=1 Tax=Raineyella sp. W15-4 TaxID=3081651 RepID=UPI002952F12F|nr:Rieske 2Fe-2S domain-containing protein [Raineyella sp. W15-4]WOQ18714.1 Rieske 2Fe-2S domain-containing protein [Raineyella sp. W15-4]